MVCDYDYYSASRYLAGSEQHGDGDRDGDGEFDAREKTGAKSPLRVFKMSPSKVKSECEALSTQSRIQS